MKISVKELLNLINIGHTKESFKNIVSNIVETLTKIGLEVESVVFEEDALANFVIAKVEECKKHPESEKLSICSVNNGIETFQVLCGAPNVCKGLKVVFAQKGAVIPKNGMVIHKTKLAGFESQGMICSADELCVGVNNGKILEIENGIVGTSYAEYIGKTDAIIDISITPNRGDCISYYGIARELVAQGIGTLPQLPAPNNEQLKLLSVEITCSELLKSAFFAKFNVVDSIKNVANVLNKSGINASKLPIINALNYITEVYGQPMHLYDASKINGRINIRKSQNGEKLITISGEEILLQEGDIVVADDEKILSLAGIIGDSRSMVTAETKEYILESCAFNRDSIFKTIRKYNIHTSASFRFERYVDCGNAGFFPQKVYAYKFTEIVKTQFIQSFDLPSKRSPFMIACSVSEITKILGFALPLNTIVELLTKLQFQCSGDEGNLKVVVPSFRVADVKQVHDIAEEIIRSIDFNQCPRKVLNTKIIQDDFKLHKIKAFLAKSLNEVITYPFVSQKDYILIGKEENAVMLQNPINGETPYMRASIIPSLLHNIAKAENLSIDGSAIFEVAKVFEKQKESIEICIARSGFSTINNPLHKKREYSIFDIKEDVLSFLENIYGLKRESIVYRNITNNVFHPYQAFEITIGRNVIATITQIHPLVLEEYSIKNKVFIANIYFGNIPVKTSKLTVKSGYKPFVLPNIKRELSVIVANDITCLDILRNLQKATKNRFTASITDIFQNAELTKENKKSILISFDIFQDTKSLISNEIEELMNEIVGVLYSSVQGVIRTNA
jgi:phenylalanyl-tRNA synthetase beta chain